MISMNWPRIFTGIVVTLITMFFILVGGVSLSISIWILSILALCEVYNFEIFSILRFNIFLYLLEIVCSGILIYLVHVRNFIYVPFLFSYIIIISGIVIIFNKNKSLEIILFVSKLIFLLILIPLSLSLLIVIRRLDYGVTYSLMILTAVSFGDIGAYYFGKIFGKKKLAPNISPKKTIEGSIGGILSTIFVVVFFNFFLPSCFIFSYCILFAFFLGILGQIGDLFISVFKRMANIKNSGFILPGHGGLLDRIDSILFTLPFSYLFYLIII